MLAFLGHLARLDGVAVRAYAICLLPFVAGVLLGGLVAGCTYASQALYGGNGPEDEKRGEIFHWAAIIFGVASYAAFGIGSWWTFEAFRYIPIEVAPAAVATLR